MDSNRNVTILESATYTIVMLLANVAGTLFLFLFNAIVKQLIGDEGMEKFYVFLVALFAVVGMAVSLLLIRFYFRYKIPDIVPKNSGDQDKRKLILKNFLFMVLPGEILRFILASLPTRSGYILGRGYRFFDGIFAFPPNFVYDRIWLMPNNRMQSIDKYGYTFTDNILFIAVYLVYFILNLFLLYLIFSRVWNQYEKERNNEFKIHMDPEQMK